MTFLISLEQVPADPTVAIGLGIDEGDALMRLTRLRLADEEPTVCAMSHPAGGSAALPHPSI